MFAFDLLQNTKSNNTLQNQDIGGSASMDGTLHHHLTRVSKDNVMKRYEVVEVIGHGTSGTISTVKLRDDKVGGSAFESEQHGFLGLPIGMKKNFTPLSDRPKSSSNYLYALKELNINCCSEIYREISILQSLDHPNIEKIVEACEITKYGVPNQLCLVLELCTGGDLYARLPYSQREAAFIVSKIVSAVSFIHQHGIVHRDIKFENILFENTDPDAEIKIIDFGLSEYIVNHKHPMQMTERVGTM
jgi:serine/threonine protein kinase